MTTSRRSKGRRGHRAGRGGTVPAPIALGFVGWFDPASGITLGTGVSNWRDRISSKDIPQLFASAQPDYNANGVNLTHASLTCSAAQYLWSNASLFTDTVAGDYTIFSEYYVSTAPALTESVIGVDGGGSRGPKISINSSGFAVAQYHTGSVLYEATGTIDITATKTWAINYRSGSDIYLVTPGETIGPVAAVSSSPNSESIRIGSSNLNGTQWAGEVGHCGLVDRALDAADLATLVSWLNELVS